MRPLIPAVLSLLLLLNAASTPAVAQAQAPQRQEQTKEQTVYITKTGKKYHRAPFAICSSSKIPVSLRAAEAGLERIGILSLGEGLLECQNLRSCWCFIFRVQCSRRLQDRCCRRARVDLSPILRQTVKTHFSLNGEWS